MGYNNNHAGMHMSRYNHYGAYDDLEYYDRMAELTAQQKAEQARLDQKVSDSAGDKMIENDTVRKGTDVEEQKNVVVQNSQKAPTKKKKNKRYRHQDPWDEASEFGKEEIIDIEHFIGMPSTVMANMMIIAMKNKKDIYEILVGCEELMKKDMRTNPEPESSWAWMSKLDLTVIFLSMVAEKLDCSVFEFFIDDIKRRTKFVYSLIDYLRENEPIALACNDGGVDGDGTAFFSIIAFDYYYGMTDKIRSCLGSMSLEFYKNVFENGEVDYAILFGDSLWRVHYTKYDYTHKFVCLLEESEGKLKDFIEEMIEKHPEWGEEV